MEGQNIFNKNNNPFPQIQGNSQFIQPNLHGNFPQGENYTFQKKDEPETKNKKY